MWFLNQYEEGQSATYNIPIAYTIKGNIQVQHLESALNLLIKQHSIFRTTFPYNSGKPLQKIHPDYSVQLIVIDVDSDQLNTMINKDIHHIFDLEALPLFIVRLYRISVNEHVLLINQHNIITDGWSVGLLLKELNQYYDKLTTNGIVNINHRPTQYVDYTLWERELTQEKGFAAEEKYWLNKFSSFQELDFPTDYLRPKSQTFTGKHIQLSLSSDLSKNLIDLSKHEHTTLYMVLLSVFNVLIGRYSMQEDVVIGTGIANRPHHQLEEVFGFFVNTLPLRTDLSGNPTFLALLNRVKATCLEAYANQAIPFDVIVDKLKVEREADRSAIFTIMFMFQDANEGITLDLSDTNCQPLDINLDIAMFDITFNISKNRSGKIIFDIQYNSDLFKKDTIVKFIDHFELLSQQVLSNPALHINELSLLKDDTRRELFEKWNEPLRDFSNIELGIVPALKATAHKYPHHDAIVFRGVSLNYEELDRITDYFASVINTKIMTLTKNKNSCDEIIAVVCRRNHLLLITIISILKAGAAYLPIDPAYPAERVQYILEDSNCLLGLIEEPCLAEFAAIFHDKIPYMMIDESVDHDIPFKYVDSTRITDLPVPLTTALAYVIYTSGSTGHPKGVMIEHRSVMNLMHDLRERFSFTKDDSILSLTSPSFDIFGLELFLPLTSGGKMILTPACVISDVNQLTDYIGHSNPTFIQATPSMWYMLCNSEMDLSNIQTLSGGEALSLDLMRSLQRRAKKVWNLYGPTETTIWSLCHDVNEEEQVLIGQPVSNTRAYVVDRYNNVLPDGFPGELLIAGEGVARGYLNKPELTKEVFIKNTIEDHAAFPVAYKTGDIVKWSSDGRMLYLGRKDQQTKVRGFRVELAEIEANLDAHPFISQSCIIGTKQDNSDSMQLVAFYVPTNDEHSIDTHELRQFCLEKLPMYMVPTRFIKLDKFVYTPNKKIDRRALQRSLTEIKHQFSNVDKLELTACETEVYSVWRDLLGLGDFSPVENFFVLGGHSLLIPQLISSLNTKFQSNITIRKFIENATVKSLSNLIEVCV